MDVLSHVQYLKALETLQFFDTLCCFSDILSQPLKNNCEYLAANAWFSVEILSCKRGINSVKNYFDIYLPSDNWLPHWHITTCLHFLLSQTTNFRLFNTGRVCRRQFDENGIKFSKRVENTAGKGKIAHYEQFLLFPDCFQNIFTAYKGKACLGRVLKEIYSVITEILILSNLLQDNNAYDDNASATIISRYFIENKRAKNRLFWSGKKIWVCIHQPFSGTFHVFFSRFCTIECNKTSNWLDCMV